MLLIDENYTNYAWSLVKVGTRGYHRIGTYSLSCFVVENKFRLKYRSKYASV